MTYLAYTAWIISLLLVAGEIDRLLTRRFLEKVFPELQNISIWFLPPAVSMILPGAGQFMNGQPLKALLSLTWPFLIYLIPTPFQFVNLITWTKLVPWYWVVVMDALVCSLLASRVRRQTADRVDMASLEAAQNLSDFLSRRGSGRTQQRR